MTTNCPRPAAPHILVLGCRFAAVYLSLPGLMRRLPIAVCLLCPVPAHVYFILSLPVPLDLLAMLTAICTEHSPHSSRFAWLGCAQAQAHAQAKAKCDLIL